MTTASETAELTLQERGILATSASAAYLDEFSKTGWRPIGALQQPVLQTRTRTYYSRGTEWRVAWQDYGQPLPSWFDPLMQGFVDLLTLPAGWDSYNAVPINPKLVDTAIAFMNGLLGPSSPAPRVVPLASGGLQVEWHRKGIDVEVVFDQDEGPYFYYRNRASGEESERNVQDERSSLTAIISSLE